MANTGQSYGVDLEIKDTNGVVILTLTNVDLTIDAQTLSEDTGGLLTVSQAQQAIDTRFQQDNINCKACLDPLPSNEFYAEILEENENSFYLNADGSNSCKTYLYA